ncbi:FMN-dependent oxidoreductase (nitrilotriacetate monooxygenase family) [Paraburkholderia sp. GAS448]|uniref:LLM class flavin-dependent oxidoreductase n=1 Tax=Paraburkholderia sp. GAS448 TaxID=3035136 RepID=UPI003D21A03B
MSSQRHIAINAFYMASPTQSWAGMWPHPRSTGADYNKLRFWIDLAKQAESGLIDCVFIADALGVPDTYGGSPDAAIRSGAHFPANDPMLLIPAMASVTRSITFGVTGNTTYEPPYLLARRLSTLDQLTEGRLAWNIVTGVMPSTAKAMGLGEMVSHDARYDVADEYMDLAYKLWEASWEDGAAIRDRARGIFTDPAKVHAIHHHSEHFSCDGIHLCEPSPQRTPLLFSAGASARGIAFAGRHAECSFMSTNSIDFARKTTQRYRQAAVAAGRAPDSIKVFNATTVIVGATEDEARDRVREYQSYTSEEGNLAIFSTWLGVDLSRYDPDDPVDVVENNAVQSIADSMRATGDMGKVTLRDLARFANVGGREAFIVGSPDQVCDTLLKWRDEADVDGFNLVRTVEPDNLRNFIDLVVPRLQERGAYKTAYKEGTMREQLFPGAGPLLPAEHYGARFRPAAGKR